MPLLFIWVLSQIEATIFVMQETCKKIQLFGIALMIITSLKDKLKRQETLNLAKIKLLTSYFIVQGIVIH